MKLRILLSLCVLAVCTGDTFAGPFIDRIKERRAERQAARAGCAAVETRAPVPSEAPVFRSLPVAPVQFSAPASNCPGGVCAPAPQSAVRRGLFR